MLKRQFVQETQLYESEANKNPFQKKDYTTQME